MSGRGGRGGRNSSRGGGRGRGQRKGRGRGSGRGNNGNRSAERGSSNNNNKGISKASHPQNNSSGARGRGNGNKRPAAVPPPSKPKPPTLKNGEKGAEVFTVSESDRIRFTKILMQLREGNETRMEFPPTLTNTERKFIHQLAGQLGLVSKSTGKGENRRIAVTKRAEVKKTTGTEESMPVLRIGKKGIDALRRHMNKHPPTHTEELESRETGASLVEAMAAGDDDGGDTAIATALTQLGLGVTKEARKSPPKIKRVDLERRKAKHAAFQLQKQSNPTKYQRMMQTRSKLPAYSRQDEIVATVAANPVTVIQGETGCGKSTQCPQFLLDANPTANIVVTQRTYHSIKDKRLIPSLYSLH